MLLVVAAAMLPMYGCGLIFEYDNCGPDSDSPFCVDADWKYAPEANPEGMAYIFYPSDGGGEWRFDFPGRQGGEARLPDGEFSVIAFNDDTSRILFSGTGSYDDLTFYCRRGGLYDGLGGTIDNPLGPDVTDSGEEVEICPDMLWCDNDAYFKLSAEGTAVMKSPGGSVEYSDSRILTLYPRQIIARYSYEVSDITNLRGVERVCASLSGMASSLRPSDMHRGTPVTLPVKAEKKGDDALIGNFLTYGKSSAEGAANTLSLYIWLADGRKLHYDFDVSAQIDAAEDPMDVHIALSGLELPESAEPVGGGGFDVSVDGWVTVIIDIKS